MGRFLRKRTITAIVSVILVLAINFIIIRAAPGDPARLLVGTETPSAEQVADITAKYGLDKPLYMQFIIYVGNLLKGDMGVSYYTNEPVFDLILERFGNTMVITLLPLFLSVLIGTAAGIVCSRRVGGKLDNFIAGITYIIDGFPSFWLGLMMMLLFADKLKWFPYSGMVNIRVAHTSTLDYLLDVGYHLVLPVATLVILSFPYFFKISRSAMVQTMGEDFITTLRATGMPERRIFNKYVFRNAILPTLTAVGIRMAYAVTGSALVEIVFSWPGMGSYVMQAIGRRDYPVLMGIYLMLSLSVAIMMILVDIMYSVLDPRVSHSKS